jgi:hypothetical protein
LAGSALLWVASALVGESWTVPQQARTGIVVAWLVIVGSVGLFTWSCS